MKTTDIHTGYSQEFFRDLQHRLRDLFSTLNPDHKQVWDLLRALEWGQCTPESLATQIPALCRTLRARTDISHILDQNLSRFPDFVRSRLADYQHTNPAPPIPMIQSLFENSPYGYHRYSDTGRMDSEFDQRFQTIDESTLSSSQSSQSQSSQPESAPMDIEEELPQDDHQDALVLLASALNEQGIVISGELYRVTSSHAEGHSDETLMVRLFSYEGHNHEQLKMYMTNLLQCLEQYAVFKSHLQNSPSPSQLQAYILADRDTLVALCDKILLANRQVHNLSTDSYSSSEEGGPSSFNPFGIN